MKLIQAVKRLQFLEREIAELEEAIDKSIVNKEGGDNMFSADDCRAKLVDLVNERRFLKVAIVRTNISTGVKVKKTDGTEEQITLQELIYQIDDNADYMYSLQKCRDVVLSQEKAVNIAFDVESALKHYEFIKERLQYLQDVFVIVQYKIDLME